MNIKTLLLALILLLSSNLTSLFASGLYPAKDDSNSIVEIENVDNLYQWGDMFLGGQPNLETMKMLHKKGVDLIINLRSEDEMEEFAESAFNEEQMAQQLGMKYLSVPVSGYQSYSPETVKKFNQAINTPHTNVFIHCRSCGRVTQIMMAYLVKYKGYSLDDAVAIGKKLKYQSTLEMLLGQDISMKLKED
ncbi:fused DSP-PTPase phosphatase/NAD kinase-like protein [Sunxiuqinia sp. A32]|uniref:fused DSP-PTPase phosphatase/NAD kinase-like protein n=1 Tax=Sunxiuqinia sp. A32 TaxID=3461496 RepID=UPI0040457D2F